MPRELVAVAPRQPIVREYQEPPLGPTQVRFRTEFAAPKHGTELNLYRGHERVLQWKYDPEWGCHVPVPETQVAQMFPRPLGNMAAGIVTEVGADVRRVQPGDRVFGHFPIRETQTTDEARAFKLPPGMAPETAVCLDPAVMAFAMRDTPIKLGDRVAIFGLGAIGLMALQLARLGGAAQVIGVDPIPARRDLALRFGAGDPSGGRPSGAGARPAGAHPGDEQRQPAAVIVIDPSEHDGDGGLAVRRATKAHRDSLPGPAAPVGPAEPVPLIGGYRELASQWGNLGVDVAVEVSGNTRALHDAIRATRFGGTVCLLSYYGTEAVGLKLGEEFHVNRLNLVSCRAESLPLRDAPGWTLERISQTCLDWLASGRLRADGMVTPIVSFEESADAYREIDEHPERSVKMGVRF